MFKTTKESPEYKRMDKLVKGDKLWTRRYRRNRGESSQGHVSTVECVMTFACPPEGLSLVEVEGNFLTPDHPVAIGRGERSTAGALAKLDTDSATKVARTVYNIKLQSGGQIELGNKVYAATLGARFDAVDRGQDPIYSEETTRYLQDLQDYSLGHIHWARGTASVDQHGMPRPNRRAAFPSEIGTSILLNKEILETILTTQNADQRWIDILNMIRRVNSTWNNVVRSIYPEFATHPFLEPTREGEETWRATFFRDKENAHVTIRDQRKHTEADPLQEAFYVQTYPATLNILVEAMNTLYGRTLPWSLGDDDPRWKLLRSDTHAKTLYSALSRHTLRPTP